MKKIILGCLLFLSFGSFGQYRKDQLSSLNSREIKAYGSYSSFRLGKVIDSLILSLQSQKRAAGYIPVGNVSGIAVDVALSGDGTLSSSGTLSVTKILGNTIPVNASGVLTNNGSGTLSWSTPGAGTVTSVAQSFTGGLISVAGSPITTNGTLALTVAGTNGGIPYFSSSSTWASSGALSANALMIGGGAGSAPTTTTTGTGVLTALGVNTGSSGSFVVNGGALGTPVSGTATNLTGLPLSTGVNGILSTTNGGTGNAYGVKQNYYPNFKITQIVASLRDSAMSGGRMVQVGNYVYLIAGYTGGATYKTSSKIYRANISDLTTWTNLGAAPFFRRTNFACGANPSTNKIYVWGSDYYGLTLNEDAWEGTVNTGTGAITWVQKNSNLASATGKQRRYYGWTTHKSNNGTFYLVTIGGQQDDNGPTYNKTSDTWVSSDGGATWSQSNSGYSPFLGKNFTNGAISRFGQIILPGGGNYDNGNLPSGGTYSHTYDSLVYISTDDGVTWNPSNKLLQNGVTFSPLVNATKNIYSICGYEYLNPNGSQRIQVIDSSLNTHQVYQTTISARADGVACPVTLSTGQQILLYYGGQGSGVLKNDLYKIELEEDTKLTQGDLGRLRRLYVDDSLRTPKIESLTSNININGFTYAGKTNFGLGTSSPNLRADFQFSNLQVGATAGSFSGGNRGEGTNTRTASSVKWFSLSAPTYAASSGSPAYADLLDYYADSGNRYLYIGGDAGVGTSNYPTQIWLNASGTSTFKSISTLNTSLVPLQLSAGTTSVAPLTFVSGSLLTTIAAFKKENNGNGFYSSTNALNRYAEGGVIADFTSDANNTSTTETDLYTYTTKASTLGATGEKLKAEFSGTFNDATATTQLQVYFAGTVIYNSTALTLTGTGSWHVDVTVIRTGSSTARASVRLFADNTTLAAPATETDLTGLTFTNTNIIKITGTAGGGTGGSSDITGKLGHINWYGAANN